MDPTIVTIAGASSNSGKTTLLCDLLSELAREQPWEAIKLTRGHYRSCGKDPEACCVSDLLGDSPTIRSDRDQTYVIGKDTGRFWDAGASNVHWVIAAENQVEAGIREALCRVRSGRVLIEGTSVLKYVSRTLSLLVVRADQQKMKNTARFALGNGLIDAIYVSSANLGGGDETLAPGIDRQIEGLPRFSHSDIQQILSSIRMAK